MILLHKVQGSQLYRIYKIINMLILMVVINWISLYLHIHVISNEIARQT